MKRASIRITTFLFLVSIFLLTRAEAQTIGSLDTSFGTDGTVMTHFGLFAMVEDMVIQPDGKVIVVGGGTVGRFNYDGTPDTSFNLVGYKSPGFGIRAVALQNDGKILVAGNAQIQASVRFAVIRLLPDGTEDMTFDTDSRVETTIGYGSSIDKLKIQPDGRILAIGYTTLMEGGEKELAMARYQLDGSLDSSFGVGGRGVPIFPGDDFGRSCVIQGDNRILIGGYFVDPLTQEYRAAVYKFFSWGAPDTGFGTGGRAAITGGPNARVDDLELQTSGKLIIVGNDIPPTRLNLNGTVDMVFSTPVLSDTWSVAIQSNGKIFVRGTGPTVGEVIVRYNPNGTREGTLTVPEANDQTHSLFPPHVEIAPDGKIVTGSTRLNNNFEAVISRFTNNQRRRVDFDGDLRTDISIFRPSAAEWWYERTSQGLVAAAQFGAASDKLVPADYTGDGRTDIATFRPATGEWYVLRSEDMSYYAFPFGTNGDVPAIADFDGDFKADPAVFRPSTATWFINRSTGGTLVRQFGTAGDAPVVDDYDGDGRDDIAVWRPSAGEWWIERSTDGLLALQFGVGSDKPVYGDYTGDGRADVAFWRPSDFHWYVLRSEDLSYYAEHFGAAGDLPVPGDYDGDGKFDVTVFRPASATWYTNRTTAGLLVRPFGFATDQPVGHRAFVP